MGKIKTMPKTFNLKKRIEEIEKEYSKNFDELGRFLIVKYGTHIHYLPLKRLSNDFYSQKLHSLVEEAVREMIVEKKGRKMITGNWEHWQANSEQNGYNQARQDQISKAKEMGIRIKE